MFCMIFTKIQNTQSGGVSFPRDGQGGVVAGQLFALEEAEQERRVPWLRIISQQPFHIVSGYKMCPRPQG